jgi:hypothetical protein
MIFFLISIVTGLDIKEPNSFEFAINLGCIILIVLTTVKFALERVESENYKTLDVFSEILTKRII